MTNAAAVTSAKPIPWWKEPTRDQWYAYIAAWLGWTLDAFDFTVFLLIMHPIAETFHVSMTSVTFVFTITLVDAVDRRHHLGLDRRSARAQEAADDRNPRLFGVQFHRRILADLPVPVRVPRASLACSWAPNGRPALRSRWRPGRSARAASWPASCRAPGASAFCCRLPVTACSSIRSAGAACCGSACCPPWPCSMCASSSRSRRSGSRTGSCSAPSSVRSGRRSSASSSAA